MRKIFILTGILLLTACSNEEQIEEEIIIDQELLDKQGQVFETFVSPLETYFLGSLYEGSIALDFSDYYDEYYEERGIEAISTQKLIHVKLTQDLEVVDLEGNNVDIDDINVDDIIYIDFDFSNKKDEFKGGEITIETDVLVVDK